MYAYNLPHTYLKTYIKEERMQGLDAAIYWVVKADGAMDQSDTSALGSPKLGNAHFPNPRLLCSPETIKYAFPVFEGKDDIYQENARRQYALGVRIWNV